MSNRAATAARSYCASDAVRKQSGIKRLPGRAARRRHDRLHLYQPPVPVLLDGEDERRCSRAIASRALRESADAFASSSSTALAFGARSGLAVIGCSGSGGGMGVASARRISRAVSIRSSSFVLAALPAGSSTKARAKPTAITASRAAPTKEPRATTRGLRCIGDHVQSPSCSSVDAARGSGRPFLFALASHEIGARSQVRARPRPPPWNSTHARDLHLCCPLKPQVTDGTVASQNPRTHRKAFPA
jgi:hypothetical protein